MRQARLHIDSGSGETGRLSQELFSFVLGFLYTFGIRKRKWKGKKEVKCDTGIDVIPSANIWRSPALKKGQCYFRWLGSQFIKNNAVQISKENWRGGRVWFLPNSSPEPDVLPAGWGCLPAGLQPAQAQQPQEWRPSGPSSERRGTPAPVRRMVVLFFSLGALILPARGTVIASKL